jgi:DASH complex subunit DAD4
MDPKAIQNPHEERQAVLLERINNNLVSRVRAAPSHTDWDSTFPQTKTIELMSEANHCIEHLSRASKDIRAVASMTDKYRKNVRYNIAADAESALTAWSDGAVPSTPM